MLFKKFVNQAEENCDNVLSLSVANNNYHERPTIEIESEVRNTQLVDCTNAKLSSSTAVESVPKRHYKEQENQEWQVPINVQGAYKNLIPADEEEKMAPVLVPPIKMRNSAKQVTALKTLKARLPIAKKVTIKKAVPKKKVLEKIPKKKVLEITKKITKKKVLKTTKDVPKKKETTSSSSKKMP